MVYVDDFFGVYRLDYDISEVHQAFKWGALNFLEIDKPLTFKGKELTLARNSRGRVIMKVTQKEFINGLTSGKIAKGANLNEPLTDEQRGELRSVAGCLQWLCGQSRPELSPAVSLNSLNSATNLSNLKTLYSALDNTKDTSDKAFVLPDVPLTPATVLVSYSDASWANAQDLRSQFGVIVMATVPQVTQTPCQGFLLDWKSGKSSRVCRSTLAAEAMAADEAVDRSSYLNLFLTEVLTGEAAHKATPLLRNLHAVDAKSLYDSIVQENPQTTEKRILNNIRSIQETIDPNGIHWVPTSLMRADGMTKLPTELMESLHSWPQAPWVVLREVKASKRKDSQCEL